MKLDVELYALNENAKIAFANAVERGVDCTLTRKQVIGVIILMKAGLESDERSVRIATLRMLAGQAVKDTTGYSLDTTNRLTGPIANFLIDQISIPREDPEVDPLELNDYGQELLDKCESHIENKLAMRQVDASGAEVLPGVRSVPASDHERSGSARGTDHPRGY